MNPDLKAATLGAANISAPASPLGASSAPELAKLYQSGFQLPQATGATNAAGNIAQEQVKAAAAAAAVAKQKQADLSNISAYKIVQKPNGGYDFFQPDGKQVDIATVSQATGTPPSKLVADSQNPIDIQYRNDYNNLQKYVDAVLSKDTKTIKEFQSSEPALQQYNDQGGIHRLIQNFQQSYQRYYVTRDQNPNAWGANIPSNPIVQAPQTRAGLLSSSGGIPTGG